MTTKQWFWISFPLPFFLSNNLCGNAFNFEINIYEIMTEEHISNSKKGLDLGVKAPIVNTKDIKRGWKKLNLKLGY